MNALRRILIVAYSLILLAALGGIGALAWNQDEKLNINSGDLNIQALITADDTEKYILTAILAGAGLIAILTLLVGAWPQGTASRGALRIRQADGGTVEVTPSAIETLLRDEVQALPEVQSAKVRVALAGGAIDTYLDVQIEPSASIAHATKLLGATVDEVLREQVGVTAVRRPVIRISYDEMAARPVPAKRSRELAELRPQHAAAGADEPAPALEKHFVSPDDEEPRNL